MKRKRPVWKVVFTMARNDRHRWWPGQWWVQSPSGKLWWVQPIERATSRGNQHRRWRCPCGRLAVVVRFRNRACAASSCLAAMMGPSLYTEVLRYECEKRDRRRRVPVPRPRGYTV